MSENEEVSAVSSEDEERVAQQLAENNALARVFEDVRVQSREGLLVQPTRWSEIGLVPDHMDPEEFEMFVYDYWEERQDSGGSDAGASEKHRRQPRQSVAARHALAAGLGGSGMQKRRLGDDGADSRRHRLDAAGETLHRRAQTRVGGGARLDREQRHVPIPLRVRPSGTAEAMPRRRRASKDNRWIDCTEPHHVAPRRFGIISPKKR